MPFCRSRGQIRLVRIAAKCSSASRLHRAKHRTGSLRNRSCDRVLIEIRAVPLRILAVAAVTILAVFQWGCLHYGSASDSPPSNQDLKQRNIASGIHHTVKKDEDLAAIAKTYGTDAQHLAEVNNLKPPYTITAGSKLFVPAVSYDQPATAGVKNTSNERGERNLPGVLAWPLKGRVVSEFGVRDGTQFNGISIEASEGAEVKAAADGVVGHVGSIPGYGNVILLDHPERLVTVYAHLKEIEVRKGDAVKRGETLAKLANSGGAQNCVLYFEVRSRSKPRNPTSFLGP
jgi:murein DD-endopeptidase MepM/ murein hydrolase activator NlpD